MKIALLADAHANLEALKAVLADARRRKCDAIWYLGDFVGYGPRPDQTTLTLAGEAQVSIIGNYDLKVLSIAGPPAKHPSPKRPIKRFAFQWAFRKLSQEAREYLGRLPETCRIECGGVKFLLVHASQDSNEESITDETPEPRLEELARNAQARVVLFGHTHSQTDRTAGGVRFVNPGSIGRAEGGDPAARYATIEVKDGKPEVRFHAVEYDAQATAEDCRRRGLAESLAQVFIRGHELKRVVEFMAEEGHLHHGEYEEDTRLEPVLNLAGRCRFDQEHSRHVTKLALMLFDELTGQHGMGRRGRFLLQCAGLLHDIGWLAGRRQHHKTARNYILSADELPFDERGRRIVALTARYHRKSTPHPRHEDFAALDYADQYTIKMLGGFLRVADGLDDSHLCNVVALRCRVQPEVLQILITAEDEAQEEIASATKKADLLEQAMHRKIQILHRAGGDREQ